MARVTKCDICKAEVISGEEAGWCSVETMPIGPLSAENKALCTRTEICYECRKWLKETVENAIYIKNTPGAEEVTIAEETEKQEEKDDDTENREGNDPDA